MGEQFKVGKVNPNQLSRTELIFQKLYSKKLKYLYELNNDKLRLKSSTSSNLIMTNDLKQKGMQFHTGKFANAATPEFSFEQRFQQVFKEKLEKLMPVYKPKTLSYHELKELHQNMLVKSSS